jgi:hypothetical protein
VLNRLLDPNPEREVSVKLRGLPNQILGKRCLMLMRRVIVMKVVQIECRLSGRQEIYSIGLQYSSY